MKKIVTRSLRFGLVPLLLALAFACSLGAGDPATGSATAAATETSRAIGFTLTFTATKISPNTFNIIVSVNRPLSPSPGSTLIGYFTLFDGGNGKIVNLPPLTTTTAFFGPVINMNYTVARQSYVYLVLLTYDVKTYSYTNFLQSNTGILTPGP